MRKIIYILPVILLSIFTFKDLFATYFQQDEWHAFGVILAQGWSYVSLHQSPLQLLLSGDRVGARFLMYLMFSWFGLNVTPYFILSLGLHLFNGLLVYKITEKLLRDSKIAYVALLFFLFSGTDSQSYAWLGTFAGSVPNMTFLLLSLYAYLKFLLDKNKLPFVFLSLILLWLSFLFKETGFFLLILYPIMHFLYKKNFLKSLKVNFPFILYGLLLVALRINEILSPKGDAVNLVTSRIGLGGIVLNAISYPLQGFSQLVFPPNVIYPLSKLISSVFPFGIPPDMPGFDLFYQAAVAPVVSMVITIVFLLIVYRIARNDLNKKYVSVIIFCLAFIFLSFVPYFIIQKGGAYLEPRYYYIASLGSSILLGIILIAGLYSGKTFLKITTVIFFFVLAVFNIASIRGEINFQKNAAIERKYIIKTIQEEVSYLPDKVLFYVSGNSLGYYGLDDLKIPFQSGLGQTLLVTYSYNEEIAPKFLHEDSILKTQEEGFLYGILDQGYREVDGRGFGYFTDLNKLKETVGKNNIDPENIYGFYYNSEEKKLENISIDVRQEIKNL